MADSEEIIQYVPYVSFVHPSFWHTLTEIKLNVDKLNETTKHIHGRFTYRSDIGSVLEVDGTSFNKDPQLEHNYTSMSGTLINKNTIEEFKTIDKAALLNSMGEVIWTNIRRKDWISNPSSLLNFIILSFADLKKFHYYYWFAFPAPSQPTVKIHEPSKCISLEFSNKDIEQIKEKYKSIDDKQKSFFVILKENDSISIKPLSSILREDSISQDLIIEPNVFFSFTDPSNGNNPGWCLRIFIAALLEHCPNLGGSVVKFLCLRCNLSGSFEDSKVLTVKIPKNVQPVESAGWVGWERNDKGNFGPKLANMSASMDPVKLADTSSDLNIKLMKWRLAPDLDVEIMKSTKCLLLGAGTLGCHVARNLLAWGFRHITFIDNGKVSYSNPTRQVLFNHSDCINGGRKKAEAAASNLRLILPSVQSNGIPLHIPMPGHPVGEALKDETIASVNIICEAIKEHDVIFLLLDTREARWLPTLLAACYGKIVINAALGFDSYLVMRHGTRGHSTPEGTTAMNSKYIEGGALGCYFCNDVTAPGNSLKDRTLDQQCTVTRPGVAAIAGALAVEILVGILQHPSKVNAPAIFNLTDALDNDQSEIQGVLGPIPHSIRGFLHSYQHVIPTCQKFKQCIACSETVINQFEQYGIEFLLKVFDSGKYLEDITGLSELNMAAQMSDVLTFSDDSDE